MRKKYRRILEANGNMFIQLMNCRDRIAELEKELEARKAVELTRKVVDAPSCMDCGAIMHPRASAFKETSWYCPNCSNISKPIADGRDYVWVAKTLWDDLYSVMRGENPNSDIFKRMCVSRQCATFGDADLMADIEAFLKASLTGPSAALAHDLLHRLDPNGDH